MTFYSVKIKLDPGKGYKPKTYTGICAGKKKIAHEQIAKKAVAYLKSCFDKSKPDLKITYIVMEVKKIKDDFFLPLDQE